MPQTTPHEYQRQLRSLFATARKAFGLAMLERMLPYELGARSTFRFARDDLRVEILIPKTATAWNWQPAHTR